MSNAKVVSKRLYDAEHSYAMAGWLVLEKKCTPEELETMPPFEVLVLHQEFKKFIKDKLEGGK